MFKMCPSIVLLLSTNTEAKRVPVHGTRGIVNTDTPRRFFPTTGGWQGPTDGSAPAPCSQDAAEAASTHKNNTSVRASLCDPFQTTEDSSHRFHLTWKNTHSIYIITANFLSKVLFLKELIQETPLFRLKVRLNYLWKPVQRTMCSFHLPSTSGPG